MKIIRSYNSTFLLENRSDITIMSCRFLMIIQYLKPRYKVFNLFQVMFLFLAFSAP